ncbi:DUF294 nucleotidyltransferase-like domain-containing protein [Heliophilum fasciatum]|uniref:CBS domain-containing protein n=1 Tax=Heliophilum fasciatum TaxID=35700 RepID=A0A4R2RJB3_9FIRM|nr:DUF294 nucleotidyltransferase-like domain-containing protein [Heliophilum fasciatum]MCW2278299.1 CBS domain-containing protein [Heliophilum fasciatum]TCP63922.1 CBS domain-containing protein [Heliophilum fasciatum]
MNYYEELQSIVPFSLLPPSALAEAMAQVKPVFFPRGQKIFYQDQPVYPYLFITLSGSLDLLVRHQGGQDMLIERCGQHFFFGESALTESTYPLTAKATSDLLCLTIERERVLAWMEEQAAFSAHLARTVIARQHILLDEVITESPTTANDPLRSLARDFMSSPIVSVDASASLRSVAQQMAEKNIGALVVMDQEQPIGIITERDLIHHWAASLDLPVAKAMRPSLTILTPDAHLYQVLLAMMRDHSRYVCLQEESKLVGIIAHSDIVQCSTNDALALVQALQSSATVAELVAVMPRIDRWLDLMLTHHVQPTEIMDMISHLYDQLTVRAIEIALSQMIEAGYGPPPTAYCWLSLGSAGRREQMTRTDQDHAILFAPVPHSQREQVRQYFMTLAARVVESLVACGFAPCRGNVMGSSPDWCRALDEWQERLETWIEESLSKNIRLLTIFLDFRDIYGDTVLASQLRHSVHDLYRRYPVGLHHLAADDLQHRAGLSFLRSFVTEKSGEHKDELDLKRSLMVHIVDSARIFALRAGIGTTNTVERLQQLQTANTFSTDDGERFIQSYLTLMELRICENIRRKNRGLPPDNYINPYQLSKPEQNRLREAIQAVSRLQQLTGSAFRLPGFL